MSAYKFKRKDRAACPDKDILESADICYDQKGHDYGLSSDDTRHTGIKHISVTFNEDGDYPGFTIPLEDLILHEITPQST